MSLRKKKAFHLLNAQPVVINQTYAEDKEML